MQAIDWIVLTVVLSHTALGIYLWNRSNFGLRLITVYFGVLSILEISSDILFMQRIKTVFLYHFSTPVLFLILSYLFSIHLKNRRLSSRLFVVCIVVVLLCWAIPFTIQSVEEVNSYAHLITRLSLCGWVVLYFRQLLFVDDYEPLIPNYMFWASVATLIHVANYFFWGIVNILYKYDRELVSRWYSNILVLDVIFYVVLALPSYRILYQNVRQKDAK